MRLTLIYSVVGMLAVALLWGVIGISLSVTGLIAIAGLVLAWLAFGSSALVAKLYFILSSARGMSALAITIALPAFWVLLIHWVFHPSVTALSITFIVLLLLTVFVISMFWIAGENR